MINPIYIEGIGSVTCQPTFEKDYFFENVKEYNQVPILMWEPVYKDLIPTGLLRRMNKSMKSTLYASKLALKEAKLEHIDAVITGTGQGCLSDSERFVETLLEDEQQLLNPTPFIQSTHNMPAATVALSLDCHGYNMTYTHGANSFETALLDCMLYLNEHPDRKVLLGGMDEIGIRTPQFWEIAGYINTKTPRIPTKLGLAEQQGEIPSEGSTMFAMSASQSQNSIARIDLVITKLYNTDPQQLIKDALASIQLSIEDIQVVFLGVNGDQTHDTFYFTLAENLFSTIPQLAYKHLLGEYDTVAAAGTAIAAKILQKQHIPETLKLNPSLATDKMERILIYNQHRGSHHSVTLLSRIS